jgi:glycosyltransferase involved in cell wall biosynthesis
MAGLADLEAALDSLQKQKFSVKNAKEVLVLVGSHVSEDIQNELKRKYPWLKLHLEGESLDYAKAKMRGAEIATGDIVIFADSDMKQLGLAT